LHCILFGSRAVGLPAHFKEQNPTHGDYSSYDRSPKMTFYYHITRTIALLPSVEVTYCPSKAKEQSRQNYATAELAKTKSIYFRK